MTSIIYLNPQASLDFPDILAMAALDVEDVQAWQTSHQEVYPATI